MRLRAPPKRHCVRRPQLRRVRRRPAHLPTLASRRISNAHDRSPARKLTVAPSNLRGGRPYEPKSVGAWGDSHQQRKRCRTWRPKPPRVTSARHRSDEPTALPATTRAAFDAPSQRPDPKVGPSGVGDCAIDSIRISLKPCSDDEALARRTEPPRQRLGDSPPGGGSSLSQIGLPEPPKRPQPSSSAHLRAASRTLVHPVSICRS